VKDFSVLLEGWCWSCRFGHFAFSVHIQVVWYN